MSSLDILPSGNNKNMPKGVISAAPNRPRRWTVAYRLHKGKLAAGAVKTYCNLEQAEADVPAGSEDGGHDRPLDFAGMKGVLVGLGGGKSLN